MVSSERSRERWALLLLAGIVAAAALACLNGFGKLYFGPELSDLRDYFYPRSAFLSRWLKRGVLPLWDPHAFGGYPVIESQQLATFYPPTLLCLRLLPAGLVLVTVTAFHVAVGAGCSYLALRRVFRLSVPGAVLGSATYAFGQVFATRVAAGHLTVVSALAWSPAALLASVRAARVLPSGPLRVRDLGKAWRSKTYCRWLALAAGLNALTILAGAPQWAAYLFWMEMVAAVAAVAWRKWAGSLVTVGAAWMLAAILTAPQWLPGLVYYPYSSRGYLGTNTDKAAIDWVPAALELLTPFPLGDDLARPHLYLKNVWETASYPGAVTLVLAGALVARAVLSRRSRGPRARVAVVVATLGVYLCVGGWLPGMGDFREPLKARSILALGLSLCAALEFDRVRAGFSVAALKGRRGVAKSRGIDLAVGSALIVVLAVIPAYLSMNGSLVRQILSAGMAPLDPATVAAWERARENPALLLAGVYRAAAWALVAAAAAWIVLWIPGSRSRIAVGALLALGCLEPFAHDIRFFESRNSFSAIRLPSGLREFFAARIHESERAREPLWRIMLPNDYVNRGHFLDGLWETGGYDPLMPREANTRVYLRGSEGVADRGELAIKGAAAVGRRYEVVPLVNPGANGSQPDAVLEDNAGAGVASLERRIEAGNAPLGAFGPDANGVHFVVPASCSRKEVMAGALDRSFLKAVNRIRAASGSTTETLPGVTALEAGESLRMDPPRTPHQYSFEVVATKPGLLLFRMTWLPGWTARIDGAKPTAPWYANNWAMAVPLEPGRHEVAFEYRPSHLGLAAILSIAGCVALASLLWPRRRARRA